MHRRTAGFLVAVFVAALWVVAAVVRFQRGPDSSDESPTPAAVGRPLVERLCTGCHSFPPPESLRRDEWWDIVWEMAGMAGYAAGIQEDVDNRAIALWYEGRAPELLPLSPLEQAVGPGPVEFELLRLAPGQAAQPAVSNVRFLDLLDDERPELVACDMRAGLVLLGRPYEPAGRLEVLGSVPHPARGEMADLDGDGRRDLLLADLGSFLPLDHNLGSVVWLRQVEGGRFEPHVLTEGLGRVADARAADFDGDDDLDLVVAEFGWRTTGHVLLLENRTEDWSRPAFETHILDGRSGAIHVPIADFNGDGRPDFAALLAQEHEVVVVYLNHGDLKFELHEVDRAPHPAWGSSGLDLADLDDDGDLDMIVTNGDTLDSGELRPYHGVCWLENVGALRFERHELARMAGVHRAEAADLDGDGDLDIVACAFLGPVGTEERLSLRLESILWLEQVAAGRFEQRRLETIDCNHPTLAVGDYDLDGDVDFAVGNFTLGPGSTSAEAWVELWENRGP